jgi:hypothetical protein
MIQPPDESPAAEGKHHRYTTNAIPWLVRVLWIGFWAFAIYYALTYLFPDIQHQFAPPR